MTKSQAPRSDDDREKPASWERWLAIAVLVLAVALLLSKIWTHWIKPFL